MRSAGSSVGLPLLGVLAWSSACNSTEAFYRVPLTELPERAFIVEFEGEEVTAVELVDGAPLRRVEPTERPLHWVSIPEAALAARLSHTPTPTLVLRFAVAPSGCEGEFPLPGERRGAPVGGLGARFAVLEPGEDAFEPLLAEDVATNSPLARLSLVVDEPRTCRPADAPRYRKLETGLGPTGRLGDLHVLADGRLLGPDAMLRVIYLLREGENAPLDVFSYAPESAPLFIRDVVVHEASGGTEVLLLTEDKLTRTGAFTRVPIEGDRFGEAQLVFDERVLGAIFPEGDGRFVLIGNEGLVGSYESATASVSYTLPFFPVDLEGIDRLGLPHHYVISDGAGKIYTGDVRDPTSMTLRPFSLLGLRETYWYETPFGPRIYSIDHNNTLHIGSALETSASELWHEGTLLPDELLEACPKEISACGDARSLSSIYRFRRLDRGPGETPWLSTSFQSCRGAIVFEPAMDCAFGVVPPGAENERIEAIVRRGEHFLVLVSSGEIYETRMP